MKTILVPVELHDLVDPTLQAAVLLGRAFGSYLEGFALSPALSPFLAADAMGATILYQADAKEDGEILREARQTFEDAMRTHGVPLKASSNEGVHFGWRGEARGDDFVGNQGRVFDITVVGRPGTKAGQPRASTLEAALFESGRPILIAPPQLPQRLGETVLIAWNGSTETARTIGFAIPLLRRARRVIVLTIEGSGLPGPTGADIAAYLGRNEIACELRSVGPGERSTGKAILDEAMKLQCDLIIKGAFTQSRLRQMIFGGATRHIIAETSIPVFMAH